MRIARYGLPGSDTSIGYGVVEGSEDDLVLASLAAHPLLGPLTFTGERRPLTDVVLLAPVVPGKVVCVGKNYADHVREMGGETPRAPVLFLKPSTSVIGPGEAIVHPADTDRMDYEGELAVVMGRITRHVSPEAALEHVFGYTCANDVTARDQQQADGQWTRAKGHDSFCPLGPWLETELDPGATQVTTTLDGQVMQDSATSLLLHPVPELISYISKAMTLLPGDVVLTGTPGGVGPMRPGQQVSVQVAGVGTLTNPVRAVGQQPS